MNKPGLHSLSVIFHKIVEFAARLVLLMSDEYLWVTLQRNARYLFQRNFNTETIKIEKITCTNFFYEQSVLWKWYAHLRGIVNISTFMNTIYFYNYYFFKWCIIFKYAWFWHVCIHSLLVVLILILLYCNRIEILKYFVSIIRNKFLVNFLYLSSLLYLIASPIFLSLAWLNLNDSLEINSYHL